MKKTGELLKKSREEKGLSVHEVALSLKINPRILQSIEEGEQSALPAKTFLRGFVQSYAKFLKLDPQEVLRLFTEEMNAANPQPVALAPGTENTASSSGSAEGSDELSEEKTVRHQEPVDAFKNSVLTKTENQNDALRARTIAISIIGLLLVIIVYFVNSVVKKYQKEAEIAPDVAATIQSADADMPNLSVPETASDSDTTTPDASTATTTPAVTAATPAAQTETQKPAAATAQSPAPAPTISTAPIVKPVTPSPVVKPIAPPVAITPPAPMVATKPAAPIPAPVVKPTTPPVQAVKPTAPAPTNTATAQPTPTAATPTGKLTEVIIEATDNVEIEYSSSKSPPQKLVLKPDQIHTFKSRSGVKLKISNGGGVNVIVNGQDRGAPGASGQPVQVSYE